MQLQPMSGGCQNPYRTVVVAVAAASIIVVVIVVMVATVFLFLLLLLKHKIFITIHQGLPRILAVIH